MRPRLGRRSCVVVGIAAGVLLMMALRWGVNRTTLADHIVAPLILPDTGGSGDAIVVLGAGVVGPCLPNHYSLRRMLLAAQLWKAKRAPLIVISGGSTLDSCPVAVSMANLAREIGIPDESVRVESYARSTRENATRLSPTLRGLGARRLLLVTDRLHMRRAEGAFTHEGFFIERATVPIYAGHQDNVSMLQAGLREYLALAYYRSRGWLAPGDAAALEAVPMNGPSREWAHPNGPIVLLGASYAAGWDLPVLAGHPVVNRGVAGERTTEIAARFETDVLAGNPRAVVIWGLVNDFTRAEGDLDAVAAGVLDRYTAMIALALSRGVEPILATEVTLGHRDSWLERIMALVGPLLGKQSYQDRINEHVLDVDAWLKTYGRAQRLLVLDLQSAVAGSGGRRRADFVADDGSHITPAGYAALSEFAVPTLDGHFRGSGSR